MPVDVPAYTFGVLEGAINYSCDFDNDMEMELMANSIADTRAGSINPALPNLM